MTALSKPRHPVIDRALNDARTWCAGHVIDDRPAFVHAVRVAATLDQHVPDVDVNLLAAVLLHDSPDFVPPEVDLDTVLAVRYGREVPRVIRALQAEHAALDEPDPPVVVADRPVLLASTADKIVALTSLLRRADASGDADAFFAARPALLRVLPHFRDYQQAGLGLVPLRMSQHLDHVLNHLTAATATARRITEVGS